MAKKTQEQNQIHFYRSTGEYGFLSNLFKRGLVYDGRYFDCAEKAYQYGKPKDREVAEWLINAPKPHLCALAAHALFIFDIVENWNDIKVGRMLNVLREKFRQHKDLREMLLATGDAVLIEDSKTDKFWGIGKKGNGQNMLGKLLQEVRAELRS